MSRQRRNELVIRLDSLTAQSAPSLVGTLTDACFRERLSHTCQVRRSGDRRDQLTRELSWPSHGTDLSSGDSLARGLQRPKSFGTRRSRREVVADHCSGRRFGVPDEPVAPCAEPAAKDAGRVAVVRDQALLHAAQVARDRRYWRDKSRSCVTAFACDAKSTLARPAQVADHVWVPSAFGLEAIEGEVAPTETALLQACRRDFHTVDIGHTWTAAALLLVQLKTRDPGPTRQPGAGHIGV